MSRTFPLGTTIALLFIPLSAPRGLCGEPTRLTTDGSFKQHVQWSPDGKTLYFTKGPRHPNEAGLFAKPVGSGAETLLIPGVVSGFWAVAEKGVYFVDVRASGGEAPMAIRFFDFQSHKTRSVGVVERPVELPMPGFSVTWDGRRVVWSQYDQASTDLMLLTNFR